VINSANETKVVIDFLEAQTPLSTFKFWGDVDTPPSTYVPDDGIGVCLKVRGGVDDDSRAVFDPSFQFKIYAKNEVLARGAARTLHDNFEGKANKDITAVRREILPVTLKDPESQWTYALVYYKIMVRNSIS